MKNQIIYNCWKIANSLHNIKVPFLPFVIQQLVRIVFACFIPYSTKVGRDVHFGHLGLGIVLHEDCIIGDGVRIDQHVTIGGRKGPGAPHIGNNVRIGAGAKILGAITIGDNVNIGANAVVLKDIPSNSTAVGIPARILENRQIDRVKYENKDV